MEREKHTDLVVGLFTCSSLLNNLGRFDAFISTFSPQTFESIRPNVLCIFESTQFICCFIFPCSKWFAFAIFFFICFLQIHLKSHIVCHIYENILKMPYSCVQNCVRMDNCIKIILSCCIPTYNDITFNEFDGFVYWMHIVCCEFLQQQFYSSRSSSIADSTSNTWFRGRKIDMKKQQRFLVSR